MRARILFLAIAVFCTFAFSSAAVAQYPFCEICNYGSEAACKDSCDRSYTKGTEPHDDCLTCCWSSCGDSGDPHGGGTENQCGSEGCSDPLLIDLGPQGLELTAADGGVWFDIDGNGTADKIAWTSGAADDAFLALDRNGNGRIDNARELFGDATLQASSGEPNGFRALAEWDRLDRGGNGDGVIGPADRVWARLLLWVDRSHDGISQSDELTLVSNSALTGIVLDYRESRRRDKDGNRYTYRSDALVGGGRRVDVVDVFFAQ